MTVSTNRRQWSSTLELAGDKDRNLRCALAGEPPDPFLCVDVPL